MEYVTIAIIVFILICIAGRFLIIKIEDLEAENTQLRDEKKELAKSINEMQLANYELSKKIRTNGIS
jgi:hypothetical protein